MQTKNPHVLGSQTPQYEIRRTRTVPFKRHFLVLGIPPLNSSLNSNSHWLLEMHTPGHRKVAYRGGAETMRIDAGRLEVDVPPLPPETYAVQAFILHPDGTEGKYELHLDVS